ncbi:MAG: M20/M25/M40 family metallo-hydrolase, partial [Pseudomonadota bacterium]
MDFLETCKKMIAIDSSPANGTGEVVDFIRNLAEEMGFKVQVDEEVHRGKREANILCFPNQISPDVELMLQAHLDTVDPGSFALWERNGRNPFHASIHGGRIYGLGTADSKLDFLCKLYAARKFLEINKTPSFAVVGTFGEQYKMRGAIDLIRHNKIRAKKVLVSQPTGMNLVYAGKGLANIEITIPFSKEEMEMKQAHDAGEGQSAQCKMFKGDLSGQGQGGHAIEKIFDYLEQLPDQIL